MRIAIHAAALAVIGLGSAATADTSSPYSGWESRQIKALSHQAIQDLRAGRGMGLALPAELNGYPGPRHVLDLADALDLTPDQRRATEALFNEMQAEAVALGAQIIALENQLDAAFSGGVADKTAIGALVADLAKLRGDLRFVHLKTHLPMRALLTEAQIERYAHLRGYAGRHGGGHSHH